MVLSFLHTRKHPVGASIHRRKESFPVKPSLVTLVTIEKTLDGSIEALYIVIDNMTLAFKITCLISLWLSGAILYIHQVHAT